MTTSMWVQMIIMFAVLVITSIGRKPVRFYRLLLPFVIMGYYAAKFLKDMTFTGNNVLFLLVAVIVGALFGIIVLGITRMEFDATAGKWYTRVGIGSVSFGGQHSCYASFRWNGSRIIRSKHISMPLSINWIFRISVQHLYS